MYAMVFLLYRAIYRAIFYKAKGPHQHKKKNEQLSQLLTPPKIVAPDNRSQPIFSPCLQGPKLQFIKHKTMK